MKRAFTLIELLVVIAIIAILAAILFPVFAQAKQAAKKAVDLSNMKQIGVAMQIYLSDYDDTYPMSYYYRNDNGSAGTVPNCGYVHWTGLIQPYVKNIDIFRSPSDKLGGMAPTNFVGDNRGYGAPSGQVSQGACAMDDDQVPRLSYVGNSLIMPRKRRSVDPMNVVSATVFEDVAGTIALAAMTDSPNCINGSSQASGVAFKTHRPTNAILLQNGAPFAGEDPSEVGLAWYYALTIDRALNDLNACHTGSSYNNLSHITYSDPIRFGRGSNYVYTDTHAKFAELSATLNPDRFQWGKRAYTAGGGQLRRPNGTPIN
ncbi:MAG: prepilin-type N-terminal cleavage/methylation domain-containing protein [Fimbriimonadaceae bacterium]|nr:prepilin-type N-terminal cleavage/methylation domain-containing protein [Fimbriimonadaceae bacterium]